MKLAGGVALVTGAGSGMGRATAQRLAAEGMQVCGLDINGDALLATMEPLGGLAITCDVSEVEQVDAAFESCLERFGRLDFAHLNAGVTIVRQWSGDIAALDIAMYHHVLGVNLHHVVYGARAAVRAMRRRTDGSHGGAIVVTASIAGLEPFARDATYTIGKHGAVALVRSIAPNLAAEGIVVHAVCPGTTDTGMLSDATREMFTGQGFKVIPAADIADAVVTVATSPLEMTGSCWVVNPGEAPWPFVFDEVPGPHKFLTIPS